MSVEDINRFTKDDVVCALEMFNEDYVTFPRDDIAKLSGTYLKAPPWNILPGLFLIPCMACGIALLQMLLTFFMRPIFSYILSCVLLLSSAYFASPFLPGNYLMFFRTEIFSENGLSIFLGFCTAFFMIVLSCVIGCLRIEQMDILEKE